MTSLTMPIWAPFVIAAVTPVMTLAMIMVGFMYNNSRLNDFRSEINEQLRAHRAYSDALLKLHEDLIKLHEEKNEAHLRRLEEMMLGKFAELDTRLTGIENRLNLH